jgi:hypothetical protein
MTISSNVEEVFTKAKLSLQKDLAGLADQIENLAVLDSYGVWADDTSSARASITGYSIGVQPYDKNFAEERWALARSRNGVSRYPRNTMENYQEHVEEVEVESDTGIILTMFVSYAEFIGGADVIATASADSSEGFASIVGDFLSKSF